MAGPAWCGDLPHGVMQGRWGAQCATTGSGMGSSHGSGAQGMPDSHVACLVTQGGVRGMVQGAPTGCACMVWRVAPACGARRVGGMEHGCLGGRVLPQGVAQGVALGCDTGHAGVCATWLHRGLACGCGVWCWQWQGWGEHPQAAAAWHDPVMWCRVRGGHGTWGGLGRGPCPTSHPHAAVAACAGPLHPLPAQHPAAAQ